MSSATLDLLASRLVPGGHVLVATDQEAYAAHVRSVAGAHPLWHASNAQRPTWRPVEGFEAKGIAAGRVITEVRLTRRDLV